MQFSLSPDIRTTNVVITIEGINYHYTTCFLKNKSRVSIEKKPDGSYIIEAPTGTTAETIQELFYRYLEKKQDKEIKETDIDPKILPGGVIHVRGLDIPYTVVINRRRKTPCIRASDNGTFQVELPELLPEEKVIRLLDGEKDWFFRNYCQIHPDYLKIKNDKQEKSISDDTESGYIEYNGQTLFYTINRTRRAKRLTIKIDRNNNVQVVCPPRARISDISALMNQKADWVFLHTTRNTSSPLPRRDYCDGEIWPYLGGLISLRIQTGEKISYKLDGDNLIVTIPSDGNDGHRKRIIQQVMASFFADSLYQYSLPHFKRYGDILDVPVPQIKIRDQKTKWGACTPNSITLNLRLSMADPEIIQYVIAHEMAHKVHANHSSKFWDTVEHIMPDYQLRKEELKKNGYTFVI